MGKGSRDSSSGAAPGASERSIVPYVPPPGKQEADDRESEAFWKEFAAEAAAHAAKSEKAAKIIRDCVITRKAPGRAVPSKVTYQRTTTETSNIPLKRGKGRNKAT